MSETAVEVGYGLATGAEPGVAAAAATRQALAGLTHHAPALLLVFASVRCDLHQALRGVRRVAGTTPVVGATSAGEICNGPAAGSLVVVALASPHVAVHAAVGRGVSRDWARAVEEAAQAPAVARFFRPGDARAWRELTHTGRTAVGLLFSPGNTSRADSRAFEITEELKRRSGGMLPFFGGCAADDWQMERNYVLWNEEAYADSLLVVVLETALQVGLGLDHGFRPTDARATVTCAVGHEVRALDGAPAADVFARLLGKDRRALEGQHLTLTTGKPAGFRDPFGQYSLSIASRFTPEGGVRLSQPVIEGTVLTIMEADADSLAQAAQNALRKAILRGGIAEPAVALVCSCALRPRLVAGAAEKELAALKSLVPNLPVLGFYSFGEQGVADDGVVRHNNAVITTLVLGRGLSFAARVAGENARLQRRLERDVRRRASAEEALRAAQAELERRVEERTAALRAANTELEREVAERRHVQEQLAISDRMASMGTLAAGVAHEINNPLAAVLAGLDYALAGLASGSAGPEREEIRDALTDARDGAVRVRSIVRDLKLFSRSDDVRRARVDVRRVMESALRMAWNEIRHRARLVKLYGEVPAVEANESRLGQVFINLVVNAAQAIPEGHAEHHVITVETHTDGVGRAVLEVRDTGAGISPDALPRIFEPFYTSKPVGVGTGLGLSICRRIVTEIGGAIGVESELGRGTTFRVLLPAAATESAAVATPASAPAAPRGRILVVDDDPMVGKALTRMLTAYHEVTVVTSARDARATLAAGAVFDLILCDLMMPEVTGAELHHELARTAPQLAQCMVFLTGGAFTPQSREFLATVANPRLEKPFDTTTLLAVVNRMLLDRTPDPDRWVGDAI